MLSNVLRDAPLVDHARVGIAPLQAYLDEAVEILMVGRRLRGASKELVVGAVRHALAFSTWHSLSTNRIKREDAVKLITALVETAVSSAVRT